MIASRQWLPKFALTVVSAAVLSMGCAERPGKPKPDKDKQEKKAKEGKASAKQAKDGTPPKKE